MLIHNGDHLQYEIDNKDTTPKERSDWPLPSFDAKDWAEAFCRQFIITTRSGYDSATVEDDVGLMIAWFANALMRGYDQRCIEEKPNQH